MAMDVVVVSDRCLRPTPLSYIDPLDLYLNTSYILRKSVVKLRLTKIYQEVKELCLACN